jgi:predicted nuclease of restriction endonuclease-like RecB superfamily
VQSIKKKKPRNKFEKALTTQLRRAKVNFGYETERIPYILACHYIPDFIISTPTGKLYIEAKGYFRPEARRKMLAIRKLNPQLDIRFIFYAKRKINIKWCEKHSFKYAIEKIPKEWLEGM